MASMEEPPKSRKRARSADSGGGEGGYEQPNAKKAKKIRYVICPHAPERHKIRIRLMLRQRKAVNHRAIPSRWCDKHAKLLDKTIAVFRDAAEGATEVTTNGLRPLWELRSGLDNSKPIDLPDIGDRLQTLVEILGHPTFLQRSTPVPEQQAHAMLKLFLSVFRVKIKLPEKYCATRMKVVSFHVNALQLRLPDFYVPALGNLGDMLVGWDRRQQVVPLEPETLYLVCLTAVRPPFLAKGVSLSLSELTACREFLQKALKSTLHATLPANQVSQLRQWVVEKEDEIRKFGSKKLSGKKARAQLRGPALWRASKVPMKPSKPNPKWTGRGHYNRFKGRRPGQAAASSSTTTPNTPGDKTIKAKKASGLSAKLKVGKKKAKVSSKPRKATSSDS